MMYVFDAECDANTFIISKVRKIKQLSSTIRQQVDVKGRRPVLLPTNFVHLRTDCDVFNRLDSIHHRLDERDGSLDEREGERPRMRCGDATSRRLYGGDHRAVEEATAATADSAKTRAKGASRGRSRTSKTSKPRRELLWVKAKEEDTAAWRDPVRGHHLERISSSIQRFVSYTPIISGRDTAQELHRIVDKRNDQGGRSTQ